MIPRDLHDFEDVAENYDLYLDAMYREEDNHAGFLDFYLDFARERKISLVQMETDSRVIEKDGKTYGIQRINAYHSRLKGFLQKFHGVSSKYLGNYIVWHGLMENNRRKRAELFSLLLACVLTIRKTVYGRDIPRRPALPAIV